ncbi:3-dehydroquinate synthase [Fervidibacillus halotolerans]|uniref:3-dehydroquinate synthase n=1 Tax=Fervidibacillus halotolerans TaxID=2980027 RepID=A0A9E8S1Q3_9BACI|nr:3-dehydroquinate synthase [Fervidibacillus halotolerans]WAA13757.1 3-dehydroquinate synthase [Fervidibacillus halotolerans]
MEKTIPIQLGDQSYLVNIGHHALEKLTSYLQSNPPSKLCIISDETVSSLHMDTLLKAIPDSIPRCQFITPNGEKAKSMDVYRDVLTYVIGERLDRSALFIAFGGGAVGDLTGFCAATYIRGVPFIQVPTTLLAHDSSVGGKTGINHPLGKNLIGAFHHPKAVFYHLPFLQTLPKREWRSGFAEIIKASLISKQPFFDELQRTVRDDYDINIENVVRPLVQGIETKKRIVEMDERERGLRAYLNFGHTLGHALENELGYGKITHGEAVLIGIVYALRLSQLFYNLAISEKQFKEWVERIGFDLTIIRKAAPVRLLNRMKNDKKTKMGKCNFVLLEKIGQPILKEIDDETILQTLATFISDIG